MGVPISIRYTTKFTDDQLARLILIGAAAPSFIQRENYLYGMKKAEVNIKNC
ncbi:hypothetical protein [Halobacillus hunanensis]|uniref:hypothetical protein n=1 Tax=Halobacillus hunanensis TaxID=578214 RepID=UPI001FE29A09|nr:hypothetical protein [Halobacillus hunanensis]